MNLSIIPRNLFSFGFKRLTGVIAVSSIRDSTPLQSRAFCESKYPRGSYNIMADGSSLVEQYSKRAKIAVGLLKLFGYPCVTMPFSFLFSPLGGWGFEFEEENWGASKPAGVLWKWKRWCPGTRKIAHRKQQAEIPSGNTKPGKIALIYFLSTVWALKMFRT